MAQTIAFWAATTAYGLSAALYFFAAAFGGRRAGHVAYGAAWAGLLPHAMAIGLRWHEVGHGPYSSRYEVLSSNVWLLVAAFCAATLPLKVLRGLGVAVLPVAFLGMGWAVMTFGVKSEVPIIFKSYWLFLHIAFAKLFGATALLASACAAAFLAKERHPRRLPKLPSPEALDLYGHQFLLVSFLCLGVMIAAGSLWAHQSWGRYWGWDPIETSALVTWIGYGVVLHFRVLHRWSGRRMAYLTFAALALALTTVYVVALVVPTVHNSYMVGP